MIMLNGAEQYIYGSYIDARNGFGAGLPNAVDGLPEWPGTTYTFLSLPWASSVNIPWTDTIGFDFHYTFTAGPAGENHFWWLSDPSGRMELTGIDGPLLASPLASANLVNLRLTAAGIAWIEPQIVAATPVMNQPPPARSYSGVAAALFRGACIYARAEGGDLFMCDLLRTHFGRNPSDLVTP